MQRYYIQHASKSGRYVKLSEVPANGVVTLGFKITASESFTLTAKLQWKDLNGQDMTAEGTGTIPVQMNEEQKKTQTLANLLAKANRKLDSDGQIKSAYTDGDVDHVRLIENGEEVGHLLFDYQTLKAQGLPIKDDDDISKVRFTFISTGTLGGAKARLSIDMPSKLHVHREYIHIHQPKGEFFTLD